MVAQREFFDFHRDDMPTRERELPPGPRYNGERSTDEQINLRVGAMRLLGFSDRAIERECAVDRRTIPHRLEWLARAGRIPAQKDRLLRVVGEAAEKSGLVLNSLLDRAASGEIDADLAAMIRSVATANGIAVEKVQLLTGAPTEIIEQRAGTGRDEIEAFVRSVAVEIESRVTPIESKSIAGGEIQAASAASEGDGYLVETSNGPGLADRGTQAEPGATVPPTTEGGRGGLRDRARGEKLNGSNGFQNLVPLADGSGCHTSNP
jgi:hypothetical protein